MGYGMASHLLKSGFSVIGYNVYQPAMERLVAEGGQSAFTPREAAMGVEFLRLYGGKLATGHAASFPPRHWRC